MDFIFSNVLDGLNLHQGDILERTPELKAAIGEAHSYYANSPDYTHFVVLTQSCDLVRRNSKAKSRYITIAAARPLRVLVDRMLEGYKIGDLDFPYLLCSKEQKVRAQQLLENLLHNTADGFFFIRKNSIARVQEDLCAFLPLSIALGVEHYDVCLQAKTAQMNDIFAAKLGWLTGNLYSRVATPDLEEKIENADEYKERFYDEVLYERAAWLSPKQFRTLKTSVRDWHSGNPGQQLTIDVAKQLVADLPSDVSLVAERVVSVLTEKGLLDKTKINAAEARSLLMNDIALKKLIEPKMPKGT